MPKRRGERLHKSSVALRVGAVANTRAQTEELLRLFKETVAIKISHSEVEVLTTVRYYLVHSEQECRVNER
jgi:hypothetical protein